LISENQSDSTAEEAIATDFDKHGGLQHMAMRRLEVVGSRVVDVRWARMLGSGIMHFPDHMTHPCPNSPSQLTIQVSISITIPVPMNTVPVKGTGINP
jgi:hypothetical protein